MSFALFNDKCLLPAFCKPHPDELLSSWLTRMAFDHGLSTFEFCQILWSRYVFHQDIDRTITDERMQQLADKTNCTYEEVKATTLRSYESKLFKKMLIMPSYKRVLHHNKKHPRRSFRTCYSSGLMFCPKCLKEKKYFKKQWRLAISFICTDCRCYLKEGCPHCNRGNSFMDLSNNNFISQSLLEYLVNCHHCNKDVTACEIKTAPEAIIKLQHQLYAILNNGVNIRGACQESYFKMLYYLTCFLQVGTTRGANVNEFVNDVITRNGLCKDTIQGYKGEITQLTVEKRAAFIMMAHSLLDKWPFRMLNLCIKHNLHSSDVLSIFKNAPFWFTAPIIDGLCGFHESTTLEEPEEDEEDGNDQEADTDRKMQKRLRRLKYDFDMDNYHYYGDDFENVIFEEGVENYLYEMSMCKASYG